MPGTPSKVLSKRLGLGARAVGLVRAVFVGFVIVVAVVAASLSNAEARIGESLLAFGDELAKWTSGKVQSGEGRLALNGVTIHRTTVSTPLGVKETLDRLQQVCRERGGFERAEGVLKQDTVAGRTKASTVPDRTFRHESKNEGVLACIETDRALTVSELSRRLQDFERTGNLASVGKLRYVLARREANVTSLLVLWTEGDAPLLQMFPETGDAPGRDVPDVLRPEHSRRLLSALDQGSPYAVTVYRSDAASPASVRDWYEHLLASHGWLVSRTKDEHTLVVRRGGRTVVIRSVSKASGPVTTSIVELS